MKLLSFLAFFLLPAGACFACGYSFIGACSTSIGLRINGTVDSFSVDQCYVGAHFDGLALDTIQSLELQGGKAITWESCTNNVTGVGLYYRVYPLGNPGGAWSVLSLTEDYNTLVGPYTTRYRSRNTFVDLCAGLSLGEQYVLEIYYLASVDTLGDDFIPETTLLQDNNGQNYHLTFIYGGNTAPPFCAVVTRHEDLRCHADSSGQAGVTVYGNQENLFYSWSNKPLNFPFQFNLTAGEYTVTVSGTGGYTQSRTIRLLEPDTLTASFEQVLPLGCNGTPGQALAVASGGTAPYQYLWINGVQTPLNFFTATMNAGLTVTDVNGCTAVNTVVIDGESMASLSEFVQLCPGQTYVRGGQLFDQSGVYQVDLPAPSGCDTLLNLTIEVATPMTLATTITPASGPNVSDGGIGLSVSGGIGPYQYLWNNSMTSDTVGQLLPAVYCVTVTDQAACIATICGELSFILAGKEAPSPAYNLFPNPAQANNMPVFTLAGYDTGEAAPALTLVASDGKNRINNILPIRSDALWQYRLPEILEAGIYFFSITNGLRFWSGTLLIR